MYPCLLQLLLPIVVVAAAVTHANNVFAVATGAFLAVAVTHVTFIVASDM